MEGLFEGQDSFLRLRWVYVRVGLGFRGVYGCLCILAVLGFQIRMILMQVKKKMLLFIFFALILFVVS